MKLKASPSVLLQSLLVLIVLIVVDQIGLDTSNVGLLMFIALLMGIGFSFIEGKFKK